MRPLWRLYRVLCAHRLIVATLWSCSVGCWKEHGDPSVILLVDIYGSEVIKRNSFTISPFHHFTGVFSHAKCSTVDARAMPLTANGHVTITQSRHNKDFTLQPHVYVYTEQLEDGLET